MQREQRFCQCDNRETFSLSIPANGPVVCYKCRLPVNFQKRDEDIAKFAEENKPPVKVDARPLTIFCDIDGCILPHDGTPNNHQNKSITLLPGVKEKLDEWKMKDYRLILTTGRKECTRKETEEQLKSCGLDWDQLIMGLGGGFRVLINDRKPGNPADTAVGITIDRNKGLADVKI